MKLDKQFSLMLTSSQRRKIRAAARKVGLSAGAFMRRAALLEAERVTSDVRLASE